MPFLNITQSYCSEKIRRQPTLSVIYAQKIISFLCYSKPLGYTFLEVLHRIRIRKVRNIEK